MPHEVLLLGSSHIKRITYQVNSDNLNLDRNKFTIMAHGVSGLYVKKPNRPDKSIASQLRLVSLTRPDILVIVCGSNDLSSSVCNIHQLVTARGG